MSFAELVLRIGTAAILLLTGIVMLRDRRQLQSGPFSGLMALSVAADTIASIADLRAGVSPWLYPLVLLSMGTPAMMWIWVGTMFVDDFRPSWRDATAWAVLPLLGVVDLFVYWRPWMGTAEQVLALVFIVLAGWRAVAGLRGDLVERRRRLRPAMAILAVLYAAGTVAAHVLADHGSPAPPNRPVEAALLAALSLAFALLAMRARRPLFEPPVIEPAVERPSPNASPDIEDEALLARLRALMEEERIYRREGFGVGALVAALDLPEYRLRRLINQRLGHRNFSSFVNSYRLAEATAALADPTQANVPVLTIALDAGFQSIGPFNRAFKAHTGLTPTEYRRQAESRKGSPI